MLLWMRISLYRPLWQQHEIFGRNGTLATENGFRKGGVGSYHMEAEYPTNPEYKNLRKAIQIMNPSTKPLIKY